MKLSFHLQKTFSNMNKYGLIGKKISYSMSPKLHHLIGKRLGCELVYELMDIDEEEIIKYLNLLKEKKYQGFNVTIPYKEKVIKYLDVVTISANKIRAVNTIYLNDEGLIVGDNTDYYGFLKLVERNNVLADVQRAYVLGTGGSAKTVFHVLNDKNIEVINVSRNKKDKKGFKDVISYEEIKEVKEIDLLINCTPIGNILNEGIPIKKSNQKINKIIDLTYNPLTTKLMSLAEKSYNGLEMLIFQGIKSQSIWNKKKIDDEKLFKLIKEAFEDELIR